MRPRPTLVLALVVALACSGPAGAAGPSSAETPLKLGERPLAPTVAEGSVWVPNSGSGTIDQVGEATGHRLRTVRIGSVQSMLAQGCAPSSEHAFYSGSFQHRACDLPSAARAVPGAVWVAANDTRAVVRLDPRTGSMLASVPVGASIWELAATPEMVWATDYFGDSAVRIDPASNRVVFRLTGLPHGPTGIAIGEGAVWIVTSSGSGRVVRVDPASNRIVAVIDVGLDPMGVVAALGAVWVANETSGTVSRIDPATNSVTATIAVGPREGREGLDTLVAYRGGIWLGGGRIQRIDPSTNRVDRRLAGDAVGIAAGDGIWATTILGTLTRVRPQ